MSNRKKECWKDIEGWENGYQISTHGRVLTKEREFPGKHKGHFNKCKERTIKLHTQKSGYVATTLQLKDEGKKPTTLYIHRLVAEHFIDNPNNHPDVFHLDRNKLNNNVDNLEWVPEGEGASRQAKTLDIPIHQYTYPDYEFVRSYKNPQEFIEVNPKTSIVGVQGVLCGRRLKHKNHFYSRELLTDEEREELEDKAYKIYVYTYPELVYLGRYLKIMDAAKQLNCRPSNITRCASGYAHHIGEKYHFSYHRMNEDEINETRDSFYKIWQYEGKKLVGKYRNYQDVPQDFNPTSVSMSVNGRIGDYKGYDWYDSRQFFN